MAVLLTVAGSLASPLTDVDTVDVRGVTTLDVDAVRDRSGIAPGDQLVALDLAAARTSLRALPMVAAVSVRRQWPDTVRISVVEEEPLLQLRTGSDDLVVSRTGRVLPDDAAGQASLPVLDVAAGALEVGDRLPDDIREALVVYLRLPDQLTTTLGQARLDEDGLTFLLPDEATVRFGPVEDVPAKLVAVQSFLQQVALQCLDVLDVRQPDLPTASRIDGCAAPPPTDVAGTTTSSGSDDQSVAVGDDAQ